MWEVEDYVGFTQFHSWHKVCSVVSGHPQASSIVTLSSTHICIAGALWSLLATSFAGRPYKGFESFVVCPDGFVFVQMVLLSI
jgi:hypothetical protein